MVVRRSPVRRYGTGRDRCKGEEDNTTDVRPFVRVQRFSGHRFQGNPIFISEYGFVYQSRLQGKNRSFGFTRISHTLYSRIPDQ